MWNISVGLFNSVCSLLSFSGLFVCLGIILSNCLDFFPVHLSSLCPHPSFLISLIFPIPFFLSSLPYWSLNLWLSSFLVSAPFQTWFLLSSFSQGTYFFICQKCSAKPEPHYFHNMVVFFFCLIVFSPSYNMVSLTLTAGCLQLLSCFNSDREQV